MSEIESKLSKKGFMYLGGKEPSYEDREAIDAIADTIPDAEVYPHTFAWFCIVSRFTPGIREKWGGLKTLQQNDWQNALGKFNRFNID